MRLRVPPNVIDVATRHIVLCGEVPSMLLLLEADKINVSMRGNGPLCRKPEVAEDEVRSPGPYARHKPWHAASFLLRYRKKHEAYHRRALDPANMQAITSTLA